MAKDALPHWAATHGSRLWVHMATCIPIVGGRVSTHSATTLRWVKRESASLETTKMTALLVTPELGLEQEDDITMLARVETKIKRP